MINYVLQWLILFGCWLNVFLCIVKGQWFWAFALIVVLIFLAKHFTDEWNKNL